MNEKYKIGVVGDKSAVGGFLSLGFLVEYPKSTSDAFFALESLKNKGCNIVYITNNYYEKIDVSDFSADPFFSVIPIPAPSDTNKTGINRLRKFVEKAVGADILFNK